MLFPCFALYDSATKYEINRDIFFALGMEKYKYHYANAIMIGAILTNDGTVSATDSQRLEITIYLSHAFYNTDLVRNSGINMEMF